MACFRKCKEKRLFGKVPENECDGSNKVSINEGYYYYCMSVTKLIVIIILKIYFLIKQYIAYMWKNLIYKYSLFCFLMWKQLIQLRFFIITGAG